MNFKFCLKYRKWLLVCLFVSRVRLMVCLYVRICGVPLAGAYFRMRDLWSGVHRSTPDLKQDCSTSLTLPQAIWVARNSFWYSFYNLLSFNKIHFQSCFLQQNCIWEKWHYVLAHTYSCVHLASYARGCPTCLSFSFQYGNTGCGVFKRGIQN